MHPIKHFITITRHRHKVMHYCFKVGIGFQGLFHDLSKYSFKEFWTGAKYYSGKRSPNSIERESKGYSAAWLHHKGRNKHHFDYWLDIVENQYIPIQIPIRYLKESFCDRIAACKVYKKKDYTRYSALEYYQEKKTKDVLHPSTEIVLKTWLGWICEFGEKEAFKKVKKIKTYQDMETYFLKIK